MNRRRMQRPLSQRWRLINVALADSGLWRHWFWVIKLCGAYTVAYRGVAKNLAGAQTMFAWPICTYSGASRSQAGRVL